MNKQDLIVGDSNASIKKGSKEVLDLVKPWADTSMIWIVLGDNMFASLMHDWWRNEEARMIAFYWSHQDCS